MPSLARPGSIIPGHDTIAGTRTPPSQVEPFAHRNGVNAESGHVSISGPLSDEITTIVDSSWPVRSSASTSRPQMSSSSIERVLVRMLRGRAAEEVGVRVVVEVRAAGAVVEEPGPLVAGHALDERLRVARTTCRRAARAPGS